MSKSKMHSNPFERLTLAERRAMLFPATLLALGVQLLILGQVFNSELDFSHRINSLGVGVAGIAYTLCLFGYFYPRLQHLPLFHWSVMVFNALILALLRLILPQGSGGLVYILAIMIVATSAIISGRWLTYAFVFILALLGAILPSLPFASDIEKWAHIFSLLVVGTAINETLLRLGNAIQSQVKRLETINQVSRKITSALEIEQVLALVSAAVQESIQADTYFVGLVQNDRLRLEFFYDDGEYFPPKEIPLGGGLAGWVLENRRPLLLRDVPNEAAKLGVETRLIGKPKASLSWMGTPMIAGHHVIGLMAMASYRRSAFNEADLELLENMAHQAALVIDNAIHHAEVKRQAQLDSLTQVYNHGNLLAYLEQFAHEALVNQTPLSLIMLDVDYFKHYNDLYGHLVGDQALTQVVAAVRENVRASDIVGRWGGEEFAILLPETNGKQAMHVAERIRQALQALTLVTPGGHHVPAPTVSQGIAMLSEVASPEGLVDLADQRLYVAKERGRNQIEPDASHWEALDVAETAS